MRNWLYRTAIAWALRRPAPNRIPLSLPRAAANDFFYVELQEPAEESKSFVVEAMSGDNYQGMFFNTPSESAYMSVALGHRVHEYKLSIRYYLRGYEFVSTSPLHFLIQQWTGYPRLVIWFDKGRQYLFNQRRLTRHDRIELLRMFVTKTMLNSQYQASASSILHELHSLRSFSHPQREEMLNYYRIQLESFAATGELQNSNTTYRLTGHGTAALAEYEMEERRFRENLRQQRLVGRLTYAIIAVGLLQAAVTFMAVGIASP